MFFELGIRTATATQTKETLDKSNVNADFLIALIQNFLPRVADCPGLQCITFLPLKPAERA